MGFTENKKLTSKIAELSEKDIPDDNDIVALSELLGEAAQGPDDVDGFVKERIRDYFDQLIANAWQGKNTFFALQTLMLLDTQYNLFKGLTSKAYRGKTYGDCFNEVLLAFINGQEFEKIGTLKRKAMVSPNKALHLIHWELLNVQINRWVDNPNQFLAFAKTKPQAAILCLELFTGDDQEGEELFERLDTMMRTASSQRIDNFREQLTELLTARIASLVDMLPDSRRLLLACLKIGIFDEKTIRINSPSYAFLKALMLTLIRKLPSEETAGLLQTLMKNIKFNAKVWPALFNETWPEMMKKYPGSYDVILGAVKAFVGHPRSEALNVLLSKVSSILELGDAVLINNMLQGLASYQPITLEEAEQGLRRSDGQVVHIMRLIDVSPAFGIIKTNFKARFEALFPEYLKKNKEAFVLQEKEAEAAEEMRSRQATETQAAQGAKEEIGKITAMIQSAKDYPGVQAQRLANLRSENEALHREFVNLSILTARILETIPLITADPNKWVALLKSEPSFAVQCLNQLSSEQTIPFLNKAIQKKVSVLTELLKALTADFHKADHESIVNVSISVLTRILNLPIAQTLLEQEFSEHNVMTFRGKSASKANDVLRELHEQRVYSVLPMLMMKLPVKLMAKHLCVGNPTLLSRLIKALPGSYETLYEIGKAINQSNDVKVKAKIQEHVAREHQLQEHVPSLYYLLMGKGEGALEEREKNYLGIVSLAAPPVPSSSSGLYPRIDPSPQLEPCPPQVAPLPDREPTQSDHAHKYQMQQELKERVVKTEGTGALPAGVEAIESKLPSQAEDAQIAYLKQLQDDNARLEAEIKKLTEGNKLTIPGIGNT